MRGHGGGRGGEGEGRGHGPVECVVGSYGRRGWGRWLGSGVAAATHHHVVCTVHEWYAVCPLHFMCLLQHSLLSGHTLHTPHMHSVSRALGE